MVLVSGRKVGEGVVVMTKGVGDGRNGADIGGRTKELKYKLITAGILPTNGANILYFL